MTSLTEDRLSRLENNEQKKDRELKSKYVQGRLRTDRTTAPSSNSDVNSTDKLGDIIRTSTYEYILVNDNDTLKWARHAIDVTW